MKRKKKWLCILLAVLTFVVSTITAYGDESTDEDITQAPYFFVESEDGSIDNFPLKETNVSTNINGVIAETFVTQTYANEGSAPINAKYVFPASTKVTVHGMKMTIGERVITAQIKEKEEAKQEFEQAKSEGKSASLLEQQRPNVFNMDVANIMPGDVVQLELHYTEMIVSTENVYQFVFPTVVGPRYASSSGGKNKENDHWVSTPYIKDGTMPLPKYNITVNLSTGVPIADLTSTSHEIQVVQDQESTAAVTLANPEDFAGDRDFILDYKLTGEDVSCGLVLSPGESENFFMLMVQPPERFKPEDIPPREYLFVLDVSGSMEGYALDVAKELIQDLVSNLKETDRFNLILFSDTSVHMAPESVPATSTNIQRALTLIDKQSGGGGTELAPALENAVAIPADEAVSRSVVIITDGYMSDETDVLEIVDQNISNTNFFSFGIGGSVNRYLIEGIAKTGLGEAFIVTDPGEALVIAERFRTYIQSPLLTNIEVNYQGFDVYDVEPAKLPTLFAQRPLVVFGKWRGEAAGSIQITGKTGNRDYIQEIPVAETAPLEGQNGLRYLWARSKVDRLTNYGLEDSEAAKAEITEIGLNYNMMTPYTSFIAVTDIVRNPEANSTDVNQPLPLPENVSELAVGGGYTVGSEPGGVLLFAFAGLLLVSTLLRKRERK